ncbi:MAG: class I SAM-dependent methyltransferase family protein [Candidatus Bathyarchaeota archaeon]|nr:class I SAM-dependent methyltransferase family protein [Candidatus Bathyarchaeota archaeon]
MEASCLKVPKTLGEKAIILLRNRSLLSRELKIQQAEDHLYIPLIKKPLPADVEELEKKLPEFEISTHKFPERAKRHHSLLDVLEDKLPPHLLATVPRAIDFVGEIAVVEIPPELERHKGMIGEAIISVHKQVHTVLAKSGAVEGIYRLREFEVIAGAGETETIHKEYGCSYHVDLAKAYFSPRLSHEHDRVASIVKEGETIVDMFAGVGPFSILIAKRHENIHVYAIDVNPDAIALLKRNLKENRVEQKVTPILGDAVQIIGERLSGIADRVIMNLPERAIEYVDSACETLKREGGIVHYYDFTNTPNPLETARVRLTEAAGRTSRNIKKILFARKVRAIAPYAWQVVVDAEIK